MIIREEEKEKKKSRKRDKKKDKSEIIENAVNIFFGGDGEPFTTPIFTIWVTTLKSAAYMTGNIFRT